MPHLEQGQEKQPVSEQGNEQGKQILDGKKEQSTGRIGFGNICDGAVRRMPQAVAVEGKSNCADQRDYGVNQAGYTDRNGHSGRR